MAPTVFHPLLNKDVAEARGYQLDAVRAALGASTLLVLPTGLGKTPVAWMVIAERLRYYQEMSNSEGSVPWILVIAPTNPLVIQHRRDAEKWLNVDNEKIIALTGKITPEKRTKMYSGPSIIISTPQIIRNDVKSGILSLSNCVLLVADEAHHSTGKHSMAEVGDLYGDSARNGLVLGCTASPGSTENQVQEVCNRLLIDRIFSRKTTDPELKPYIQNMEIVEIRLPLDETIKKISEPLENILMDLSQRLQTQGFLVLKGGVSIRSLRESQLRISQAISAGRKTAYQAARQNADAQRINSLLYLLQGQGINSALKHLERIDANKKKEDSQARFISMPQVRELLGKLRTMDELHPKIPEVKRLVKEQLENDPLSRVIVFASWRDSVSMIIDSLSYLEGATIERFVGQASREGQKGMTQKSQVETLDRFRQGESNVLVCTSVGEEGLDVPSADRVIFYEPVASEIRTIQRRGRTARHSEGDVFVLVSEDTRDVGVRHAAAAREIRMIKVLEKVRRRRRPPRIHPNPDSLIEKFVISEGEFSNSSEFIRSEYEKLRPEFGKNNQLSDFETKRDPVIPESKIIRRDSPKLDSKSLRPKSQMSITDFINQDGDDDDEKWRNPVLDGSE